MISGPLFLLRYRWTLLLLFTLWNSLLERSKICISSFSSSSTGGGGRSSRSSSSSGDGGSSNSSSSSSSSSIGGGVNTVDV